MSQNQSHSARNNHYDNILQVSVSGEKLSTISIKRAKWYVKKGLGELELKPKDGYNGFLYLKFNHKIRNKIKTADTIITKNECVVCQSKESLELHHVVPQVIRSNYPVDIKANNRQWCVLLCHNCHRETEKLYGDLSYRDYLRKLERFCVFFKRNMIKLWIFCHGGPYKVNQIFKKQFLKTEPKFLPDEYLED